MIAELRTDLIADLETTGYPVYPIWADKVTVPLPAMFVSPPSEFSYVEASPTFEVSAYIVRFDVEIVIAFKESSAALAELENVIEAVCGMDSDWKRGMVIDAPNESSLNNMPVMSAVIHVSKLGNK